MTKKIGMKIPKPGRLELEPELRMGHRLVAIDQRHQRARRKRAEDRLEPDLVGKRGKPDQQHKRRSHPDLRGRVLQPREHPRQLIERSKPAIARPTSTTTAPNKPSRISVPAVLLDPLPEKNSDSRMIAPKSAIEAAAITSWPKLEEMLPESLSTGTITPSEVATSTIATNSGDLTKPPACRPRPTTIAITNETTKPSAVSFRILSAQALQVDLEPRQKQQKRQAHECQDRNREIRRHPAKPRRADDDPEHDLEHDRGEPEAGEEAERQRGEQTDGDDDEQIGEVDSGHGR